MVIFVWFLLNFFFAAECCQEPVVEIVVSPLVSPTSLRLLDLIWDVGDHWFPTDWLALYDTLPGPSTVPLFRQTVAKRSGWVRTDQEEGRRLPEEPNFTKVCLGYWVVYWRSDNSTSLAESCLKTNPRWMEENMKLFSQLRLNDMFIPGTHDSGAFHLGYSPFSERRLAQYVFTQDETLQEQAIHGARLFDLRVAHYKGHFWLNHGLARLHPLDLSLQAIKEFVENTQEILILDFHEFPVGFANEESHRELIAFLRKELDPHLAPKTLGWAVTLRQLWKTKKRIILSYNNERIVKEEDVAWPAVSQKWADAQEMGALFEYFKTFFGRGKRSGNMWCAMAQLTHTPWTVLSGKMKGLRVLADENNKEIASWFRGDWGATANGVAVDFIRSTDLVEIAIRWNKRRVNGVYCS